MDTLELDIFDQILKQKLIVFFPCRGKTVLPWSYNDQRIFTK